MKKIIFISLIILLCQGCFQLNVPLYGSLRSDPGVRVYKNKDTTIINITHRENKEPKYDAVKIIHEVMK